MKNPYSYFTTLYFHEFMEDLVTGEGEGGLYNEKITVKKGKEGIFEKKDIRTFVRFQHINSEFVCIFGFDGCDDLENNPDKLAREFLKVIDTDWDGKDWCLEEAPDLIKNAKTSLRKITKK